MYKVDERTAALKRVLTGTIEQQEKIVVVLKDGKSFEGILYDPIEWIVEEEQAGFSLETTEGVLFFMEEEISEIQTEEEIYKNISYTTPWDNRIIKWERK